MKEYKIDKKDIEGKKDLMMEYMKGNGKLWRKMVKDGECIGDMKKDGVKIFK
jgi:hypothetical protein